MNTVKIDKQPAQLPILTEYNDPAHLMDRIQTHPLFGSIKLTDNLVSVEYNNKFQLQSNGIDVLAVDDRTFIDLLNAVYSIMNLDWLASLDTANIRFH